MLTCVCRPVSANIPKMPPSIMPAPKQRSTEFMNNINSNNNNNNNNITNINYNNLNSINNNNNNISNNNNFNSSSCNNNNKNSTSLNYNNVYSNNKYHNTNNNNNNNEMVVVTSEPKIKVPGRLTSAELRAMALRQQQQIDSQHQLLATKEQRLRFLKQQEVRNAVANAEGERLRRLRERVEAQESKLRRLRALRGQVDLQKTYNVTLSNDLDSIRALFSEKEKELSLAVAKVEALTRQLEDLRRDRRCPINLIAGGSTTGQPLPPQASRELEKLRRELMYRNQLSLQQDARLHLQREALQQRQAELRSVDQRIYELQTRLQRKKQANVQTNQQNAANSHLMQQQQQQQQQQQLTHHGQVAANATQQQQQQQQSNNNKANKFASDMAYPTNIAAKTGVAALKQQLLQKQANQAVLNANNAHQSYNNKFANIINRGETRSIARGNVAAVEPYIHTPQKSTITSTSSYLGNILKHAAATANTNQQNQLIQDHAHVKLNLSQHNSHSNNSNSNNANSNNNQNSNNNNNNSNHLQHVATQNPSPNFFSGESDESKLAKKMLTAAISHKSSEQSGQQQAQQQQQQPAVHATEPKKPVDTSHHIYAEVGPKKRDLVKEVTATLEAQTSNATQANQAGQLTSKIPKSIVTTQSASALISKLNSASAHSQQSQPLSSQSHIPQREKSDLEKKSEIAVTSETLLEKNTQQLTVHSMPLGTANKSVATGVSAVATNSATATTASESCLSVTLTNKAKSLAAGSLVVPPRKPISSVAPTSVTSSSIPKMINYSPKVNRVAPSVLSTSTVTTSTASSSSTSASAHSNLHPAASQNSANNDRPALPPKPHKMSSNENTQQDATQRKSIGSEALPSSSSSSSLGLQPQNINDNLPIKAKPLTIRKQPMCEQPRLKSSNALAKPILNGQNARKSMELGNGPAYLFGERRSLSQSNSEVSSETNSEANSTPQYSPNINATQTQTAAQQQRQQLQQQSQTQQGSPNNQTTSSQSQAASVDEPDRSETQTQTEEKSTDTLKRRMRSLSTGNAPLGSGNDNNAKPKLTRRVSFDPLALLLDASLEGELELVKKTAMQVANPSAANDEGITALHNAICAGHFDIVKFLVEFGCDVNAQDSDGWTPLHCAASCNNLAMVKFLVENGACLFASTLSDHETPAEKCEEDEEGFDGCSEYLYSIQEKLGILHAGEVYAVFSYEAQNTDELTFNVNERLVILRKGDDAENEWWWAKNEQQEEGYVPRNLLGLYPRVPPQAPSYND